jgi:hypothetical protein
MKTIKFQFPRISAIAMAIAAFAFAGGSVLAQDNVQSKTPGQMRAKDSSTYAIYGSQLMTNAERNEYRIHMRSLKTKQEREAYRLEHHKLMQERAREKGLTLPELPPAMGKGKGPGPGPGGMVTGPSGNP